MTRPRARRTLEPGSLLESAYHGVKTGIVRGQYAAGQPLSEVSLAADLGMSRTPVREGLSRLWTEGYLERVAGHGYFVARVTLQAIHDTFDVRRLLEGAAAARVASHASAEEIAALRTLAIFPSSLDYGRAEAVNARFHMAIAAAARNRLAADLIARCLSHIDRFMSLGVSFGPFRERATAEHLAIVNAIAAHDADRACARMEEHLDRASRAVKEALVDRGRAPVPIG